MASPDEYAAWIVKNADKRGTPEFETVANAYKESIATSKPPETSQGYQTGRKANETIRSVMTALQGPTLGFADEISGAINAPIQTLMNDKSLGENYRNIRDRYRGAVDQSKEDSPWLTGITQAMTSAPLMALKLPAALQAAAPAVSGWMANTGRAALAGAGFGGVQGAGESTADTLGGVLSDASNSAASSAVLSGGTSPVLGVLGATGKNVAQRVMPKFAASHAQQKVAEALARDARGTTFTSGQANPATQTAARFNKLGPQAAVVDAGGRNTNQLLDTLATLPGRTKDATANFLHRREAQAGPTLRSAAERALGTSGKRLSSTVDDLIATRDAASKPLYDLVRNTRINPSQALMDIVEIADDHGAVEIGKQIAKLRGQTYGLDRTKPGDWGMGDLDMVKRGLDDKIAGQTDLAGKMSPLGAAYNDLRVRLIKELDNATIDPSTGQSVYKNARAAFSGPSSLIDAANAGKKAMSLDEAGIIKTMKGMSAGELQAFRVGLYEGIQGKLGTQSGRTEVMNMWKNQSTQEKLKAAFGNQANYRQFAADVSKSAQLKRLQSVGVGSQTASRQAGMGDLDMAVDAGQAVGAAQSGNIAGMVSGAANLWNRVSMPQTVRDQMGDILLSQGLLGRNNIGAMSDLIRRINANQANVSQGVGLLGAQAPKDPNWTF